ncbi:thiamine pyrophosphate-dependent dehydrogenase E1 component subunit alpha [Catenovulum maritimum]|uniref:Dehydrogenase E1 component domain-containing protein n=1 Tax=Catenovulum maritimum TaxID=1513271 RepID=A0A0J8GZE0_9ALTE|nr:thiamine pyrophosphate-dependent dehydrogenase E1 component subunit alpha [Catenovulum maritimum]KMT66599.1 hypothetical protein XM47_03445 [Catenovulum maritimum]
MTSPNLYTKLFEQALKIRLVEEEIIHRYPTDKIQSPVHLSIGQEAVAVGICNALTDKDNLFATYRSHAFYLAKGGDLNAMMAELYGRVDGCCHGKGGSMHLAAPEVGFMGTSAVVASSISNAAGAALAAKLLNKNQLNVVIFGDGATEEGVYHETLNYAALHQLPVIFVCENNEYAVHSELKDRQSYSILEHAQSYGIATQKIEKGYDFIEIDKEFSKIADTVRTTGKPYFVEIMTCRYKEHVGPGEDFCGGYRTEDAVNHWKSLDPICTDTQMVERLSPAIMQEILASIEFAENSPFPGLEELYQHVI